ncbi:MAG: glycosyltransferase family 2 protein [Luminiphilus sp.]|nr:glycosyltransferase family 2 protein [Luminiphilus sp.]MDG1461325.1 glycosyltransferase family 2 protein [Luminiphilus sp.]
MRKHKLSCFLIVCNEGDRLDRCLKGLAGWVDQLVILDSGSSDNTVEIAERCGAEVHCTDWPGFGAQRNRALTYCQHEWVLNIDADEEITPELQAEIDLFLSRDVIPETLVKIPWQTILFGKAVNFGRYASPQGKLFFKNGARFKDAAVHETLILPIEKVCCLSTKLIHYSWRDYRHLQEKHIQYAALSAADKFKSGKRSSLAYASLRFFTDFIQQYLLRLGCLDGWRGFLLALVLGQYAFNKYAGLVVLQRSTALTHESPL